MLFSLGSDQGAYSIAQHTIIIGSGDGLCYVQFKEPLIFDMKIISYGKSLKQQTIVSIYLLFIAFVLFFSCSYVDCEMRN